MLGAGTMPPNAGSLGEAFPQNFSMPTTLPLVIHSLVGEYSLWIDILL